MSHYEGAEHRPYKTLLSGVMGFGATGMRTPEMQPITVREAITLQANGKHDTLGLDSTSNAAISSALAKMLRNSQVALQMPVEETEPGTAA